MRPAPFLHLFRTSVRFQCLRPAVALATAANNNHDLTVRVIEIGMRVLYHRLNKTVPALALALTPFAYMSSIVTADAAHRIRGSPIYVLVANYICIKTIRS